MQKLLDWLAVEFMDSGWNVKHIVKLIVTSNAYKQSSRANEAFARKGSLQPTHRASVTLAT